jgi:hypothetical protein
LTHTLQEIKDEHVTIPKLSDGAKSECEKELIVIVIHKNNDPINAISGLTEVDPLSSLKRSITQFFNVIV